MAFPLLTPSALEGLAAAVRKRRLTPPWSAGRVAEYVSKAECQAVVDGLTHLTDIELTPRQIAHVLQVMADDWRAVQAAQDRLELVWSGPEQACSCTRETSVVVRELFWTARQTVLISSYGIDHGDKAAHLFRPLAENMAEHPELIVRLFLNVRRPMDNVEADDVLLRKFAEDFRHKVWPWERLPEIYYDPRALAPPSAQRVAPMSRSETSAPTILSNLRMFRPDQPLLAEGQATPQIEARLPREAALHRRPRHRRALPNACLTRSSPN